MMKYLALFAAALLMVAISPTVEAGGRAQIILQQNQCVHGQQLLLQNVGHHQGVAAIVVPQSFGFFQNNRGAAIRLQINGNRGFNRGFRQGFRRSRFGFGDRFGNRSGFSLRFRR